SAELASLGFEYLGDFGVQTLASKNSVNFARLFAHRGAGCFAFVEEVRSKKHAGTPTCGIVSSYEQGWDVETYARPVSYPALARLPRLVATHLVGAMPSALFARHRERCELLEKQVGTKPIPARDAAQFFSGSKARWHAVSESLAGMTFLTV